MTITLYHGTNSRIEGAELRPGEQEVIFASRSRAVARQYAIGEESRVDWDDPYAAVVTITLDPDAVVERAECHGIDYSGYLPSDAVADAKARGGVQVLLIDWTIEETRYTEKHDAILDPAAIVAIEVEDYTEELTLDS